MIRYLDTFFRHPWRYLLLLGALVALSIMAAERATARVAPYTATATFAANLDPTRGREIGVRPPSEQYAELLGELIATDAFVAGALTRDAELARFFDVAESPETAARAVRRHWRQQTAGPNTIRVSYSCDQAERCAAVVNAVLTQYQEEITNTGSRLTGVVTTFYREQLAQAEQRLRTMAPADPARDQVRATYDALLARIADVDLSHQLDEQTRRAAFRVLAPATPPGERNDTIRAAAVPLLAGGVGAATLLIALLLVVTAADRTVRAPEEITARSGLPVALALSHERRLRRRRATSGRSRAAARPVPLSAGIAADGD